MATPDIGTTISEAYSRGIDRVSPLAAAAIVPALVLGAIDLISSLLLSGDAFGGGIGFAIVVGAQNVVQLFLSAGVAMVLTGALYRERRDGRLSLPSVGASLGASVGMIPRLMPKLGLFAVLAAAAALVGELPSLLGTPLLIGLFVVAVWLFIRWTYVNVIAGSGEATGDAAFERSDSVVSGSWWPTFGVWIVIWIAIGVPLAIAAAIIGSIFGVVSDGLQVFGNSTVSWLGGLIIGSVALESAWHQLAPGSSDGQEPRPRPPIDERPRTDGPFI